MAVAGKSGSGGSRLNRTAFVICPLRKPNSKARQQSDFLFNRIVRPVLTAPPFSYQVDRADIKADGHTLDVRIRSGVANSDLLIADLSGLNPNVMYELGLRHAWGSPAIHFSSEVTKLPFDIQTHEVIRYTWTGDEEASADQSFAARNRLHDLAMVVSKGAWPVAPIAVPAASQVAKRLGLSLVTDLKSGGKEHYEIAREIFSKRPSEVFLAQRSSTLVLGPEAGWSEEAVFYSELLGAVDEGTRLYCVVSLEGIRRHLERADASFPSREDAVKRLHVGHDRRIGLKSRAGVVHWLRLEPSPEKEPDIKPDRQARTLVASYVDGSSEAVIVLDLGITRDTLRFTGSRAGEFLAHCREFYNACGYLHKKDLEAAGLM